MRNIMCQNDITALFKILSQTLNKEINTLLKLDDLGGITAELYAVESVANRLEQLTEIVNNIPLK